MTDDTELLQKHIEQVQAAMEADIFDYDLFARTYPQLLTALTDLLGDLRD